MNGKNVLVRLWQGKDWEWTSKDYEHIDFDAEVEKDDGWVVGMDNEEKSFHMISYSNENSEGKQKRTITQSALRSGDEAKEVFNGIEIHLKNSSFHSANFVNAEESLHYVHRWCLQVEDIEIKDRVSGSLWNTILTYMKTRDSPRETESNMLYMELIGLVTDPQSSCRVEHRLQVHSMKKW